jgi:hypothetical protein
MDFPAEGGFLAGGLIGMDHPFPGGFVECGHRFTEHDFCIRGVRAGDQTLYVFRVRFQGRFHRRIAEVSLRILPHALHRRFMPLGHRLSPLSPAGHVAAGLAV